MLSWLSMIALDCYYMMLFTTSANNFPRPLTAKEEAECFRRIKAGDETARGELIEHNLRLVVHVVKKYWTGKDEQDDLISIGTLGLIKAVSTFDPDKGTRLATYAARCIENEVLMYFRSSKKLANEVHMYDPIDTDKEGNTLSIIDILACSDDIDDRVDLKMQTAKLYRLVASVLSDTERRIIVMRYGLFMNKQVTQREAAQALGISRSYVSRIEKRAIEKLRAAFDE